MKDMAIISYAILECSSDGQYIEVLILTQSSMVYLVKERFLFVEQILIRYLRTESPSLRPSTMRDRLKSETFEILIDKNNCSA